jgi:general secretion pathway protein E
MSREAAAGGAGPAATPAAQPAPAAAPAPGLPRATLADYRPLPDGRTQYPLEYMEANGVIKLRETGDVVHIGLCDSSRRELMEGLRAFHDQDVRFYEIDRSELSSYLGGLLSGLDSASATGAAVGGDDRIVLDRLANDAPVVNLVNSLVIDGIRARASDIHIEGFSEATVVRYRIDGRLRTVHRLEPERFAAISSRIKIMANLNIMERRLPQDGRLTVHLDEDVVDVRASIVPISAGESIVLRLFPTKRAPLGLEETGLDAADVARLRRMALLPNGLLLVTGPTGSGKTTTLNAVLREVRSDALKIITIEDPVEYVTDGIDQIQTNERIGLTFDTILRRVLRQDPDVIMVGEIRDAATAELAIRAALTGHLVLSTLHTRDSVSAITRLANMGVEPYLIAAVLRGVVAQRLVRQLCAACRKRRRPGAAEGALLARWQQKAGALYTATGCGDCGGSGYAGRLGLFEVLEMDGGLEELATRGVRESELRERALAGGLRPLIADGIAKCVAGLTTLEEVERSVAF